MDGWQSLVKCAGFENRKSERAQGFKSLTIRQPCTL